MRHVILGNGIAGVEAALVLRARDAESRVTIVSAEHDHFSRPARHSKRHGREGERPR